MISIIIAAPNEKIAEWIKTYIDWEKLGVYCISEAYSMDDVQKSIKTYSPSMILAWAQLSDCCYSECMQNLRKMNFWVSSFVLGSAEDLPEINKCLAEHAICCQIKPFSRDTLSSEIQKVLVRIQRQDTYEDFKHHIYSLRQYFVKQAIFAEAEKFSLSELNNLYFSHFQAGLFRAVFVRMDSINQNEIISFSPIQFQTLVDMCQSMLAPYCYDVLCTPQITGFRFLMNSSVQNEPLLQDVLSKMQQEMQAHELIKNQYIITLCVGGAVDDIKKCQASIDEADIASWSRTAYGLGGILHFNKSDSFSNEAKRRIVSLTLDILHAIKALDSDKFIQGANNFFHLPKAVLRHAEAKEWSDNILNQFFSINENLLNSMSDAKKLKKEIRDRMNLSRTLEEFENSFISSISGLIDEINDSARLKKSLTIRMALKYIDEHYAEPISLELVADEVKLSPVYFSYLFKHEMNCNFSEYIIKHRIEQAKLLLQNSDINIGETARSVGYSDQRYFSKAFKKIVGLTPKAYKNIYI